jgi:hypothetical protein
LGKKETSSVAFAGKAQSAGDMSHTLFLLFLSLSSLCVYYVLFFLHTQTARESKGKQTKPKAKSK